MTCSLEEDIRETYQWELFLLPIYGYLLILLFQFLLWGLIVIFWFDRKKYKIKQDNSNLFPEGLYFSH